MGRAELIGIYRGTHHTESAAFIWNAVVSLPIYQFLVYRWLWRWLTWSRLLWGISRLPLCPSATHPDRQGGLGFLSEPSVGFAYVLLGIDAVQAAVWGDRIRYGHDSITSLKAEFTVSIVLACLLALGPLLAFFPVMWRTRHQAVREYDALAADYTRAFHRRWIESEDRRDLLGTSDIQSLADLAHSYEVMATMRLVPISGRLIILIIASAVVPVIPLLLMQVPLFDLIRKLGGVALGGLPG